MVGWNRWGQVSEGEYTVEGGHIEKEPYNWLLRGGVRREAVAVTNCVGAARARNVCVRAAE